MVEDYNAVKTSASTNWTYVRGFGGKNKKVHKNKTLLEIYN